MMVNMSMPSSAQDSNWAGRYACGQPALRIQRDANFGGMNDFHQAVKTWLAIEDDERSPQGEEVKREGTPVARNGGRPFGVER